MIAAVHRTAHVPRKLTGRTAWRSDQKTKAAPQFAPGGDITHNPPPL